MSTKQFTVRMESQGGAQVKTELAGIGEAGKTAHEKISQGAKQSGQSTEQMTQEQARASRAFQQLKASIDPAYAAQLKYDGAVKQVQRATTLGIASKEEEKRVLAQLAAQHDQTVAAMQRGVTQTAAIGRVSGASTAQVANLGAQFNDIGVMLAAGQSPLQLAVQQGTQINQVFAQMGGGTAALRGVAAGIASMINPMSLATIGFIAGGAALLYWAQSAIAGRNEAVDMEKALDSLNDAVSDVSSFNETARQSLVELRKEFGDNAAAVRDNARALRDLAAVKAMTALEDTVQALAGSVSEAIVEFERLEGLSGRNAGRGGEIRKAQIEALREEVGFTADEARRLREAFAALSTAEGLDGATASAQALYAQMVDIFGSAQDIPPELQEAARQALQAANAGYDIEAAMNGSANAAANASANAGALSGQLSVAATYAAQLAANLSAAPSGIRNFQQEAERLTAQIAALDAGYDTITASAAGYRKELEQKYGLADAGSAAEDAYISAVINRQVAEFEGVQRLKEEYSDKASAIQKVANASGGSAKASKAAEDAARSAVEQLQDQIEADRELIGLSDDLVSELEARRRVEDALAQDKVNWNDQAIQGLTDQIILNQQLRDEAEQTSGVLRTVFDGLASGDISSIGSGLKDMAQGSFSDLLQTSFAKGGGGFGGVWKGITSGFSGVGSAISGIASGTSGVMAGIGGAISAAMPMIGAALAAFDLAKGLIGTTTKLTNALEGTLDLTGLARGTEYDIKQNDNMFGSSTERNSEEIFGSWAGLIAQDLDQEFRDMVQGTRDGIRALGLDINEAFTYDFDVQFDESLPHEQLMERLRAELDRANDELLRTSLAAAGLARDGESGAQTLQALNASLGTANASLRLLDQTLFDISAIGAGAARDLVEVAGGLDAFSAKTTFVFDNFLTETQRTDRALQIATENMAAFETQAGITLPATHAEFMALLDAQDLNTAAGRNLYAALLDVSDEFVTVNGAAADAAVTLSDHSALLLEEARLLGNVDFIRAQEMAALDETGQAIKQRIFDIQDEQAALAALAAVEQERAGLLTQIARATGNVEFIRQQEVAATSELLRPLKEYIFLIQDQTAAVEAQNAALRSALVAAQDLLTVAEDDLTAARTGEADAISALNQAYDDLDQVTQRRIDSLRSEIAGYQDLIDEAQSALVALSAGFVETTPLEEAQAAAAAFEGGLTSLASAIDRERSGVLSTISNLQGEADALRAALFPEDVDQDLAAALQARDVMGDMLGLAERLASASRDVLRLNEDIVQAQRRSALAALRGMLSTGRVDAQNLDRLISDASAFSDDEFATFEDMAFEQAKTGIVLQRLSEMQRNLARDAQSSEDQRAADARETALAQLAALESQITAEQANLTALGALEAQWGLVEDQLSAAAIAANLPALQQDARAAKDAAILYYAGQIADNQTLIAAAGAQVTELQGIRAEYGLIDDAILTVEAAITNLVGAQAGVTSAIQAVADAVAAVGTAQDVVDDAQDAVDQAPDGGTGGGDGTGGSITDAMNSAEKRLFGILSGLDGASGTALLGVDAFGAFSADNMNAILSEAGVAGLTGSAAAAAQAFEEALGRNIDVAGLGFYTGVIDAQTEQLGSLQAAMEFVSDDVAANGEQFNYAITQMASRLAPPIDATARAAELAALSDAAFYTENLGHLATIDAGLVTVGAQMETLAAAAFEASGSARDAASAAFVATAAANSAAAAASSAVQAAERTFEPVRIGDVSRPDIGSLLLTRFEPPPIRNTPSQGDEALRAEQRRANALLERVADSLDEQGLDIYRTRQLAEESANT